MENDSKDLSHADIPPIFNFCIYLHPKFWGGGVAGLMVFTTLNA